MLEKTYKVMSDAMKNFFLRVGFLEKKEKPNKVKTHVNGLIKKTSILERMKNIPRK